MSYLRKGSARCYLKCSDIQFYYGLINIYEYTERILTLKKLIDPVDTLNYWIDDFVNKIPITFNYFCTFEYNESFKDEFSAPEELDSNSELQSGTTQEDNDFYRFITNVGSMGNRWEFIMGDPDFFLLFLMAIVIKTEL